jgi:hypothetical protein
MSAPSIPRLRASRYIGAFPHIRTSRYAIVGQDGGQSIRAGDRTLFLFSDTLALAAEPASKGRPAGSREHFLANCAAVSSENNLERALAGLEYYTDEQGLPREILPAGEREAFRGVRFWPEHGVFVDGRVFFYYLGVQTTSSESVWGFRTLGAGLAEFDLETGLARQILRNGDWLLWRNTTDDLHFGVHASLADSYVYLFGSARTGVQSTAWLARVPEARIAERDAYEFLCSSDPSWTNDLSRACSLGPSAAEFSVAYNAFLGAYAMVYIDEYRKRLMIRTAPELWGPYSEPASLIGVPHQEDSLFVYLGFEHSAFQRDQGRAIYVSYCEPHFAANSLLWAAFDGAPRQG